MYKHLLAMAVVLLVHGLHGAQDGLSLMPAQAPVEASEAAGDDNQYTDQLNQYLAYGEPEAGIVSELLAYRCNVNGRFQTPLMSDQYFLKDDEQCNLTPAMIALFRATAYRSNVNYCFNVIVAHPDFDPAVADGMGKTLSDHMASIDRTDPQEFDALFAAKWFSARRINYIKQLKEQLPGMRIALKIAAEQREERQKTPQQIAEESMKELWSEFVSPCNERSWRAVELIKRSEVQALGSPDSEGRTLLMHAIANKYPHEVLVSLVEKTKPNHQDHDNAGKSLLAYAQERDAARGYMGRTCSVARYLKQLDQERKPAHAAQSEATEQGGERKTMEPVPSSTQEN